MFGVETLEHIEQYKKTQVKDPTSSMTEGSRSLLTSRNISFQITLHVFDENVGHMRAL